MKNLKRKLTSVFILVSLFLSALSWNGCSDSCDKINCQNGGTCMDGTCDCPPGYSGTLCDDVDFIYTAGKFAGDTFPLGNGAIWTWAEVDADGNPIVVGATFSEGMLDSLPEEHELISIAMPDEAYNTLFDHLFFNWVPHGHEPFWFHNHFDFHFVIVTNEERENVIPGDDVIPLSDKYIPQDYVSNGGNVGSVVPQMGVHWWDSTAPEVNGGLFTTTMIYGVYHGKVTFIEPMIASAYLQTHPTVTFDIKQPPNYQITGYWPTTYSITYHTDLKQLDITLEGFVKRIRN